MRGKSVAPTSDRGDRGACSQQIWMRVGGTWSESHASGHSEPHYCPTTWRRFHAYVRHGTECGADIVEVQQKPPGSGCRRLLERRKGSRYAGVLKAAHRRSDRPPWYVLPGALAV